MFSFLRKILSKLTAFFGSSKVKAALEKAAQLAELAYPIVSAIDLAIPNKTVQEVLAAYNKYGVILTSTLASGDKVSIQNAMLNLATELLRKKLPENEVNLATNILNTAVQLAVTALNADKFGVVNAS